MATVRIFSELDPGQRAALHAFISGQGGSAWFTTCDEMIRNYTSATFAGGSHHFSVWHGPVPVAAIGVITAPAVMEGRAVLVSPYAAAEASTAFTSMLTVATECARGSGARQASLQVSEAAAGLRPFAEAAGYVYSHEGLVMSYAGEHRPGPRPSFSVQLLTPESVDAYARIDRDAFAGSLTGVPANPAELLTRLDSPQERYFIARLADIPVAAAELWLRDRDGWIQSLGVTPTWQGRGLGREMLRFAVNELLARGYSSVRLLVMSNNQRALRLYLSEGFVQEKVSAVWLSKSL